MTKNYLTPHCVKFAIVIGLVTFFSYQTHAALLADTSNHSRTAPQSTSRSQTNQSNKASGFRSPVFSMGAYGDKTLGFIAEAKVASYLGSSERYAAALEINAGPKVFRANVTYGMGTVANQRLKLTFDRLQQKLDFDFVASTASTWVEQNAIGAAYAFIFENPYIESFDVGGYYAHAPNKSLSEGQTLSDPSLTEVTAEQRHIAGADAGNVHADVVLRLWPYNRLSGGVDYDSVRFNTKYRHGKQVNGVGGHVRLEQRLLPRLKVKFLTRLQQTQREYRGGIGWLLPSPNGMQLELEGTTDYVDSRATAHSFFTSGGRLNISLDPSSREYGEFSKQQRQSLLSWTQEPAVRMTEVLAIADGGEIINYIRPLTIEELQVAFASGTPPLNSSFGGWTFLGISPGFDPKKPNTHLIYTTFSLFPTEAIAQYADDIDQVNSLVLTRIDVSEVIGDVWSEESNTSWICNTNSYTDPDKCRLKPS